MRGTDLVKNEQIYYEEVGDHHATGFYGSTMRKLHVDMRLKDNHASPFGDKLGLSCLIGGATEASAYRCLTNCLYRDIVYKRVEVEVKVEGLPSVMNIGQLRPAVRQVSGDVQTEEYVEADGTIDLYRPSTDVYEYTSPEYTIGWKVASWIDPNMTPSALGLRRRGEGSSRIMNLTVTIQSHGDADPVHLVDYEVEPVESDPAVEMIQSTTDDQNRTRSRLPQIGLDAYRARIGRQRSQDSAVDTYRPHDADQRIGSHENEIYDPHHGPARRINHPDPLVTRVGGSRAREHRPVRPVTSRGEHRPDVHHRNADRQHRSRSRDHRAARTASTRGDRRPEPRTGGGLLSKG